MKALVIDFGLCVEHSLALLRNGYFDEVYYYVPWQDAFPRYLYALIGTGFEDEGLIRIQRFYEYLDKVDVVAVFDTFLGDLVKYLRDKGYKVFGPGQEEQLENDRYLAKKLQKKLGLPTQEFELVKGLSNLRKYLQQNTNKVVKLNTFRGSLETFIHYDYDYSKPFLDHLAIELSVLQDKIDFLVEDFIDGIEPGTDLYVVDGQLPDKYLWGFEIKGAGYCAKADTRDNIPKPLRTIDEKFAEVFKKYKARTLFSTEVIVDDKGDGYLIDLCIRAPMPCPSACEMVVFKNWPEIIHRGAEGELVQPDIDEDIKYVASVSLESEWANERFLEVKFPTEYRQFIKFRKVLKHEDNYYVVPGFSSVCAVVGYGKTLEEAIDMCKRIADEVKAYQLEHNYTGFEKIHFEIEKLEKLGYKF